MLIVYYELLSKYLSVFTFSMVKFIMGPVIGATTGLSYLETVFLTGAGMMVTVVILSFLGAEMRQKIIRTFNRNPRKFTPRNRKIVVVWRQYGLLGISFLTPILLSPIIGTLIVIAFGEKRTRIIHYMLVSAFAWSFVLNAFVFFIARELVIAYVLH